MSDSRIVEQIGRVLGGRYRIVAPLGGGASSRVYLADDYKLRRQVAVKLLHDGLADDDVFLRRFRDEARLVAKLNHPCVVAVHDWSEDDPPFLVTEYLAGGSLRAMLDNAGTLSVSQAVKIGLDACRGLDYAHGQGLVHRDIKPHNLLFDAEGRTRVADFGLARALAESSVTEPDGTILGTARYASPEQAQGRSLDEKSDVYSLALVLTEAVSGELPFDEDTAIGTLMSRVDEPLIVDAELFDRLKGPLEKAGQLDPEDRPTANEFGVMLMAAAQSLPRPADLSLAGAVTYDRAAEVEQDATAIAPTRESDTETSERPDREPRTRREKRERALDGKRATETPSPPARWPWIAAFAVVAALIGGLLWFNRSDIAPTVSAQEVPDLSGKAVDELPELVGDYWTISRRDQRLDNTEVGQIIDQDPAAGTELEEGAELVVFVSLGNENRDVPADLLGAELDVAESRLNAAGLVLAPDVPEFASEEVPAGSVIEVLTLERRLPTGSEVQLAISSGPAARTLTDALLGLTYDDAVAVLATMKLEAERVEDFNNEVDEGLVFAMSPEPGTEVEVGATVTLSVSLGKSSLQIPATAGVDLLTASQILEDVGLCVGETDGPANTLVVGTDPPTGTTVLWGTCVSIVTSQAGGGDDASTEDDGE